MTRVLALKGMLRGRRGRSDYKRMTRRLLRREARRDPENAPTRYRFIGWF